jgi:hypothetical protein
MVHLSVGDRFAFAVARADQDRTDACFGFGKVKISTGYDGWLTKKGL